MYYSIVLNLIRNGMERFMFCEVETKRIIRDAAQPTKFIPLLKKFRLDSTGILSQISGL